MQTAQQCQQIEMSGGCSGNEGAKDVFYKNNLLFVRNERCEGRKPGGHSAARRAKKNWEENAGPWQSS